MESSKMREEEIELLLRRACFYIKKKGRAILGDYYITTAQFEALQIVVDHNEVTISELSNKLFQAPSTITDLVDRMEAKELVIRVRDKQDRRVVKIMPLQKAKDIMDAVLKERQRFLTEALKDISDEDKEKFKDILNVLVHTYNNGI